MTPTTGSTTSFQAAAAQRSDPRIWFGGIYEGVRELVWECRHSHRSVDAAQRCADRALDRGDHWDRELTDAEVAAEEATWD